MTQIPDWFGRVGSGWHQLLGQLHADITVLDPQYEVAQVKEKFGGLRVHLTYMNPAIDALIRAAEIRSMEVCEECGLPGRVRNRQGHIWLQCLCDVCVLKEPESQQT